jgi:small subunit ribosomal protein S2
MKELLEAGVHFGHQTKRWNPKMKEYIFGERNGIYIIDLQKTLKLFKDAMRFVAEEAAKGKTILFVGTKRQAQESIAEEAARCSMFYVNNRWLGGTLTNFVTIRQSIKRLKELESVLSDPDSGTRRTKKELIQMEREKKNLLQNLSGIKDMEGLPDMLFVIDSNKEDIAVKEARRLGIPVVAVVDTNCDPDMVDWPIPGNDDALRAIKLFANKVADAMMEGRSLASEHDFAPKELVSDEPVNIDMSQYAHLVDPRLNEDVLTEGIADLDLPSTSLPKKSVESEPAPAPEVAPVETPTGTSAS